MEQGHPMLTDQTNLNWRVIPGIIDIYSWQKIEAFKLFVVNSTPLIKIFILQRSFVFFWSLYHSVIIIPPNGSADESGIKLIDSKLALQR